MQSLIVPAGIEPSEAKGLELRADSQKFSLSDGDTLALFNEAIQIGLNVYTKNAQQK